MTNYRQGPPQVQDSISGDGTASGEVDVDGFFYCDVVVDLVGGTGDCTYKLQVQYDGRSDWVDLLQDGTSTITKSGAGAHADVARVGPASKLRVETIDMTTGSYTGLVLTGFPLSIGSDE